jgi:hypothetical protein
MESNPAGFGRYYRCGNRQLAFGYEKDFWFLSPGCPAKKSEPGILTNTLQFFFEQTHFTVIGETHGAELNQHVKGIRLIVARSENSFQKAWRLQVQFIDGLGTLRAEAMVCAKPVHHLRDSSFHQEGLNSQRRQKG